MVLCDSNVWLALALSKHAHHALAREWFEGVEAASSVFFCRVTQQTFLRLLTNAALLSPYGSPPLTNRQAWEAYDALLGDDGVVFRAEEPIGIEAQWKRFARRDTASPKLWMDAYPAAFALASGYRMITMDRAFNQFDGIDLRLLDS